MYIHMNDPLNPFITAPEMDFLIISSLFSFLYLFNSITGEVANEKFWKNHRLLLNIPSISCPNFSSIRPIHLKNPDFLIICSLFSFLYLPSSITEEVANEKIWKICRLLLHTSLYYIQISTQSVHCSSRNEFPDSFLYLSSSITGEVANEKFWKNYRVLPHTPTKSYTNFSLIHLQLVK